MAPASSVPTNVKEVATTASIVRMDSYELENAEMHEPHMSHESDSAEDVIGLHHLFAPQDYEDVNKEMEINSHDGLKVINIDCL